MLPDGVLEFYCPVYPDLPHAELSLLVHDIRVLTVNSVHLKSETHGCLQFEAVAERFLLRDLVEHADGRLCGGRGVNGFLV